MATNCASIGTRTNATSMAIAVGCEADANTIWWNIPFNDISSFASTLDKVARTPISLDRQNRKGSVTNVTAAPAFTIDNTLDFMYLFAPIMHFTKWKGDAATRKVSAVTATGYTVATGAVLTENTLVIARGFDKQANNGLKAVGSGATATTIPVTGLEIEKPPALHSLHFAGHRGVADDIGMDASGNLTSTALDFTTLGINVGQYVYVTSLTTDGYARVTNISANILQLDNHREDPTADTGTGKTVDILFSSWCRNVPVNDADFSVNHMMIEVGYDLPTGRVYEYADVAVMNTVGISLPLTDKSTLELATVSKDIRPATATRRLGTWEDFTANELFNTSDDLGRLRLKDIDGNGLTTYFTECTVNVNNNVNPKNILGVLGAAGILYGNFEVTDSMTTLFTDLKVTQALRDNTTSSLELVLQNNDGAMLIDQPELTLGGGEKSFPVNDAVEIGLTNDVFGSKFGYTQSVSLFRYVP